MARLVIVSNRVPIPKSRGATAGGLAVALRDLLTPGTAVTAFSTQAGISPATDVWALGLLAYHLLTGEYFWRAARVQDGTAMMQLYEQGKWQLDDPVTKYVPELASLKVLTWGKDGKPVIKNGKPVLADPKSPPTMRQLMPFTTLRIWDSCQISSLCSKSASCSSVRN